jgi:serine/threonine protein phosphatase PrpC
MKAMADESDTAATWDYATELVQVAAVWTEKKKGRGEDAPPTALSHRAGRGVLAVYDGVGGAGARSVGSTPDQQEVSGAFVASRVAHFALEDWFVTTRAQRPITDSAGLESAILARLRATGITRGSKVIGTMVRHLPTTLAAIEYELIGRDLNLVSRWAGDSRAYVLDPAEGLHVVTRDDTEETDALNQLANDPPMTNMICADRRFRINEFPLINVVQLPTVILCATDGFFHYVETPAHFEYVLLYTMNMAASLHEWAAQLAEHAQGFSADDASLVIAAFGYPSFPAMQQAFAQRGHALVEKYIAPLHKTGARSKQRQPPATRQSLWEEYRTGYEKLIRQREADR